MGKLKCGAKRKHIVLNIADTKGLMTYQKVHLNQVVKAVRDVREALGKNPDNEYIVINIDEPYINEIIEILKKNNHWG